MGSHHMMKILRLSLLAFLFLIPPANGVEKSVVIKLGPRPRRKFLDENLQHLEHRSGEKDGK
jgi:hypothetical protein